MSKNDSVLVITLRILDEINVGYVKSIRTDLRPSLRQNSYAEIHFHFQILQFFFQQGGRHCAVTKVITFALLVLICHPILSSMLLV